MSDRYKLLFRGEVLDGQHPAVVRKRLASSAGFADAALDKLFSGKPVVVKRDADTATAAKLQAVFKQAGARLRVLPVEGSGGETTSVGPGGVTASPPADAPGPTPPRAQPRVPGGDGPDDSLELLPPGSDVLRESERTVFEPREVDTRGLTLEGARFASPDTVPEPQGPDVSHLSVAQVGVDLGPGSVSSTAPVSVPDLEVAAAGVDLSRPAPVTPVIDMNQVSFEVAPAGSELGQRKPLAPPPPPDTSHLGLKSVDSD